MDFALSILALVAGGLAVELFTGARVKPAFQDEGSEGGLQPARAARNNKTRDSQSGHPN